MKILLIKYVLCILLFSQTSLLSQASEDFATLNPIAFDYFEYTGKDVSVNHKISDGQYQNPILSGFYPDPSICRVGKDYYLINSTFAYFPGIPVFRSDDLVNWEQIGHVVHRPGQIKYKGIGVSGGIFAPAITYHKGLFYVVCTMVGGKGNFVVTASDPSGPWSDPTYFNFEGIDPSLFFDDDGRAWMVNNGAPKEKPLYDGHRAIWLQEFDYVEMKMIGSRKVLVNGGVDISKKPIWIEGPHLFKRDDWFYLSCAEGGTGPEHSQVVFRSREVNGTYVPWVNNPILSQRSLNPNVTGAVTCTGHSDLVIGPDGNWWATFLGVRPYQGRYSPMGRETFLLPVSWSDDGWPMILPNGQRVPFVVKSPKGAMVKKDNFVPLNGSFSWRDNFDTEDLSPLWIMLREPDNVWWELNQHNNSLELMPGKEKLNGRGNPSYLARRVQHSSFKASTEFRVPDQDGVSAGLAVFQSSRFYYYLGIRRKGGDMVIFLEQAKRGSSKILNSKSLPGVDKVGLCVRTGGDLCSFEYTLKGQRYILFEDADAKILTTAEAGGFVGATVGPYVYIE